MMIARMIVVAVFCSLHLGCEAKLAADRAMGFAEGVATKALDKLNPEQIIANAQVDATNPEAQGYAEIYQAWGVRWDNRIVGLIARGNLAMEGVGGVSDDPELRWLIAEKLGDPALKTWEAIMRLAKEHAAKQVSQRPGDDALPSAQAGGGG